MMWVAPARAAQFDVTCQVTNQNGAGVGNVTVTATAPDGSIVLYGPVNSASDGSYDLSVDSGTYDLHFAPPAGSDLNPVTDSDVIVTGDLQLDVRFTPLQTQSFTVSGTLTDGLGDPMRGVDVELGGGDATTDASGRYSLLASPGPTGVTIDWDGGSPSLGTSGIIAMTLTDTGDPVDVTGDMTQNLVLRTSELTVIVTDGGGGPVPDARVVGEPQDDATTIIPGGPQDAADESPDTGGPTSSAPPVLTAPLSSTSRLACGSASARA
jgi:hypothetical protein